MTARTHDTAALVLLMSVVIAFPPSNMTVATALAALLANQIGGIAPDIDQPTAPFWRNLPVGRYVGKVFGALVGGHRFLSHSLVGMGLFATVAWVLLNIFQPLLPRIDIGFVWLAFVIGMASHLIMDTFTKEGVPWLLPLPFKIGIPPLRSWRITTGKKVEMYVVLPLLVIIATWLTATHYDVLSQIIQNKLTS